jgi:hypothetical protein
LASEKGEGALPLQPSGRVRLIRDISYRLDGEEWHMIDLTLRQFSLPTTDNWQNTKNAYVVHMLESATDEVLIDLAKHVDLDYDLAEPVVQPNFWAAGHFRLFISHLAQFRGEAAALQGALKPRGVSSFVAHNDIEPTLQWQDVIESALATADALVALLRDGFRQSSWTDQEIGYAMGRGILVIPVRLGLDPYGFVGRFQALTGGDRTPEQLAATIFDILRKHKKTNRRMAEALVANFERSNSFAEAKYNAALLNHSVHWNEGLARRCLDAVEANDQIKDAFGVPEHIQRLVQGRC